MIRDAVQRYKTVRGECMYILGYFAVSSTVILFIYFYFYIILFVVKGDRISSHILI